MVKPVVKKAKQEKPKVEERPVLYPELEVIIKKGDDAITVEEMKEILGWYELPEGTEDEKELEKCVPEIHSAIGKYVQLLNDTRNRPINMGSLNTFKQEHLNRRWRFNGETMVIGKTGQVVSGQHRGISHILAEYERTSDEHKAHWAKTWSNPITMEGIIVRGVEETDDVFKTLNCGKPASLSEVLFRHEYFINMDVGLRKKMTNATSTAINILWHRTGRNRDDYVFECTHGEACEFIENHKKLIDAVKHIVTEAEKNKELTKSYVNAGMASALMYLMGTSASNGDKYRNSYTEKKLDFTHWKKAQEFWVLLASGSSEFLELRHAFKSLYGKDGERTPSIAEKTALLIKAWVLFRDGEKLTKSGLIGPTFFKTTVTERDENNNVVAQIKVLNEHPTTGGIDMEEPVEKEETEEDGGYQPSAEEIEAEKAKLLEEREKKKNALMENRKKTGGKPPAPKLIKKEEPKEEEEEADPEENDDDDTDADNDEDASDVE